MALSKNRIKYIRSLELKKNRKADKVFLAEGPKLVGDLLGHFRCRFLIATSEWAFRPQAFGCGRCDRSFRRGTFARQPAENSPTWYSPCSNSRTNLWMFPS